jgi:hypothetical protein
MATKQDFPITNGQIIDPETGGLTFQWYQFFISLWNRTGSATGNNSAFFNYPSTTGAIGQVLTSEGSTNPSIWTTLNTKLSQFTNDVGFVTTSVLAGYSTTATTNAQINGSIISAESNATPQVITTFGSPGVSTSISRADHSHPREISPSYAGTMTAAIVKSGAATWTSGAGVPSSVQPNGSLYSNSSGTTGTRLYVSSGSGTWLAVTGV